MNARNQYLEVLQRRYFVWQSPERISPLFWINAAIIPDRRENM